MAQITRPYFYGREISILRDAFPSAVLKISRAELELCCNIKAFHATETFGLVTQRRRERVA